VAQLGVATYHGLLRELTYNSLARTSPHTLQVRRIGTEPEALRERLDVSRRKEQAIVTMSDLFAGAAEGLAG
jgi:hypothetical protein